MRVGDVLCRRWRERQQRIQGSQCSRPSGGVEWRELDHPADSGWIRDREWAVRGLVRLELVLHRRGGARQRGLARIQLEKNQDPDSEIPQRAVGDLVCDRHRVHRGRLLQHQQNWGGRAPTARRALERTQLDDRSSARRTLPLPRQAAFEHHVAYSSFLPVTIVLSCGGGRGTGRERHLRWRLRHTMGWDGRRWTRATEGLPYHSPFNGISCLSSTDCFAAGQFDNGVFPLPATQQPLVENWTGTHWTRITLPHVPTAPGTSWSPTNLGAPTLSAISCVARVGCTAVGSQAQGRDAANLAQSNMGALSALARPYASPGSVRVAQPSVGRSS